MKCEPSYFYNSDGTPTDALREKWALEKRKKELQDRLSLIRLRNEVKDLEDDVEYRLKCEEYRLKCEGARK